MTALQGLSSSRDNPWWSEPESEAHTAVFAYVSTVEQHQCEIYDRFVKLAALYDPHELMGLRGHYDWFEQTREGSVSENAIQSAIDTSISIIAKNRPRVAFQTENADWSTQRRARLLEQYVEGLFRQSKVHAEGVKVFRDAAVFGTGVMKVRRHPNGERIVAERVITDEIIVDEKECRATAPRQMHQRYITDRPSLVAEFPDFEQEIERAHAGGDLGTTWAEYRPLEFEQVVVIESWRLPKGDVPGRHTICIHNATLLDEEWEHDYFPFVVLRYADRLTGWYGRGIAESLAGRQRRINRYNRQIDMQLDQAALPRMFVHVSDAAMAIKTVNRAGAIVPYKNKPPEWKIPPAVSPEVIARLDRLYNGAFEEVGISRLSAQSKKPAGIESAVALREYNDIETERFAIQAIAFEQMYVEIGAMMVRLAKEMHADGEAPKVSYRRMHLSKTIEWSQVDLDTVPYEMTIDAAGSLSRTPAGRQQAVIEWAQAGIITTDEARRLLQHPDLERQMSLYNAAIEYAEMCIELILDGEYVSPEPYENLAMSAWRFQQAYLKARQDGAPEEVLEDLRTRILQTQHLLKPPAPPAGAMPAAPPAAGMAPPAGPPAAALAAPAMNIQAA